MALLCMGKRWIPETTDDKSEEGASCKMYADMHFGGLAIYLPRFGSCDLKQLTTSLVFFPFMRSQLSVTFGQGTIHAISKKKLSAQRNIALHCDPPSITTQWSWPSDIVQPWCTCPDLGVHGRPRHSKVRHVHIISV